MSAITRFVRIGALKIEKNAPKILFVAGMIGFGATVAASSKAAIDAVPVLDDAREEFEAIEEHTEPHSNARRQALIGLGATHGRELVKIYIPTVVLGVLSVACLTKSHNILTSRNVALTAAFSSLENAYRKYRQRVVDELGAEKDTQFAHDVRGNDIVSYDDKGNTVVETVKRAYAKGESPYSFFFDEYNRCWIKDAGYNHAFLENQQKHFNLELRSKGVVFLNDILKAIGFEPTPEGQLLGWLFNGDGDGYIDFGFNRYPDFVAGYERSVLLDFNVDGIILDKI